MAKIEIKCDECGHEARVPEAFRGKKVRCLRCRAKLRVPGPEGGPPSGPVVTLDEAAEPPASASRKSRSSRDSKPPSRVAPKGVVAPAAARGGPSSKTRREVQQAIREILGDYEHAIEDSPYGFDVDLRGVAFGLARTLVEDLIASPGVRDAKLAGGTGECRITIKLEGAAYDPEDSFADDEEETEYFKRPTAADVRSPVDDEASKPPSRKKGRAPDPPAEEEKSDPGEAEDGPGEDDGDAVEALLAEGRELVGQGEVQAAIDVLEKAVKLDRSHASAVSTLGQAYARAGDWERARRAFKHLVTLQPEDTDAQIFLAAAAMDCDRLDDAREALVTALKLAPDNARAYRYAAKLYEKTGDAERAKKFRAKYEQLKNR